METRGKGKRSQNKTKKYKMQYYNPYENIWIDDENTYTSLRDILGGNINKYFPTITYDVLDNLKTGRSKKWSKFIKINNI